jgi:hypothetical protein
MWYVVEITYKIKDADLFGPFGTEDEARKFAADREGDHAFVEAVNPLAIRMQDFILGSVHVKRREAVRLDVNGFIWTGVIEDARADSMGVTVWITRDGDTQSVGVPVGARCEIRRA